MLREMEEAGLTLVEATVEAMRLAGPDQAAAIAGDLALAYSRITRALRLTMAFEIRLDRDGLFGDAEPARDRVAAELPPSAPAVEADPPEDLLAERPETLRESDPDIRLARDLPLDDLAALIQRNFGLARQSLARATGRLVPVASAAADDPDEDPPDRRHPIGSLWPLPHSPPTALRIPAGRGPP